MVYYLIKESTLDEIADAIRKKLDSPELIEAGDFADQILAIKAFSDFYLKKYATDTVTGLDFQMYFDTSKVVDNARKETRIPVRNGLSDSVSGVMLRGFGSFGKVVDNGASVGKTNHVNIINTSEQSNYTFDRNYLNYEDDFTLRTDYVYSYVKQEIDSGSMSSVVIKTDDKINIDGVEVIIDE